MDRKAKSSVLELNPDTPQYLRKLYNLERPERLDDAINILMDWIKKQNHLVKKDYDRDYYVRLIIFSKGSVERAKLKHDKLCTFKTLLPNYFETLDAKNSEIMKPIFSCFLPKLTKDHYRVYLLKAIGQKFDSGFFDYFQYLIMSCEYLQANDYCNGAITIFDYRESNLFELVRNINLVELRQGLAIIIEGYQMRLKGIYLLTSSKAIDTLAAMLKQSLSTKIAQRLHVVKNLEMLHEHVERDILPIDYGGKLKSLKELSDDFMDAVCSEEFTNYYNVMRQARTNEVYRSDEKFNYQYMGVAGSFRKLAVD